MKNRFELAEDFAIIYITYKGWLYQTLVSIDDFEKVSHINGTWFLGKRGYVWTNTSRKGGKRTVAYMHRLIMNVTDPNLDVDHADHNKLENRRFNLRVVTKQRNAQNRKSANSNSKSGYRGVFLDQRTGRWQAQFKLNNKQTYVGQFDTPEEAYEAAEKARMEAGFLCS